MEKTKNITKKKMKEEKGITLVALTVTIIVLLILAGVSIFVLTWGNGILTKTSKAKVKAELASYKEEIELFKLGETSKNNGFIEASLTAGKNNLFYNTQEEGETGTIKDVITNISDEYLEKLEIITGKLLINTKDNEEIKIAKSLGIEVNPYDIVDGVLLSTGNNLALMDEEGTLTIPDNVKEIGEGAFANSGLKTIIIPGTVKKIAASAFAYNERLETVIMQEGVEEIGGNAFQGCSNLKNIIFPDSLKMIKDQAFMGCISLEKIEIPSNIKKIESYIFSGCGKLQEVKLNQNLERIED